MNASKAMDQIGQFTGRMQTAATNASKKFTDVGTSISGVGNDIYGAGRQFTGLTAPITGAVVAAGGLTAALGWGRLKSVDSAQAQLRGLGYETADVERISGQLSDALVGGMLTMGEATSAAASGMASGVKEGQELTRYIQVLDGAVAGSTGSFDEMNQIFARIQGSGKLMTNELQMIEQRMPGFTEKMADGLGVPAEELQKMVSQGEISSAQFMDIMEDHAGDMATEYAKSWEGMTQNTLANVGIIGAALLGGVFEDSKSSLSEFLDYLEGEEVQKWAAATGEAIGAAFSKVVDAVRKAIEIWNNLPGPVQKAIIGFTLFLAAAGPILMIVGKIITVIGGVITAFGTIIGVIAKVISVVKIVMGVLKGLWVLMLANPIVLIIAAIAAIVAALVYFFTQTETGKAIWAAFMDWLVAAWEWIKETAVAVWDAVVEGIVAAWEWVRDTAIAVWQGITDYLTGQWQEIVDLGTAIWDGLVAAWEWLSDTAVAVWDGIVGAIVGAWEWIRDTTSEIWDTVVDWIQEHWDTITGILSLANPVTAVIRHWDTIKEASAAAWEWVRDKIKGLWDGIKNVVSVAAQWTRDLVARIWNGIKSTTQSVWDSIRNAISNVWNGIRNVVQSVINTVRNIISNVWNAVRNLTTNAWNGIRNAVSNGVNGVLNFVRQMPSRILSALSNLGSLLVNSGRNMLQGFVRGITSGFSNALGAVKNGMSRIRNFFPFSPAKEGPFAGSGYTTFSGAALVGDFAEGMRAAERDVVRQAEAITRAAAFDVPEIPGLNAPTAGRPAGSSSTEGTSGAAAGGVTNNFTIHNPTAEPTSETARKASAYIGVSV